MKIDSYALSATAAEIAANTSWLSVIFQNKKILGKQNTSPKKIKLNITVDGSNLITACNAVASGNGPSQWITAALLQYWQCGW